MIYKIILNFLKAAFYILSIAIICGFCWVAYTEYTIRRNLEKDRLYYYKLDPFTEQWSNFQQLLMEDIKYRRLDLPIIYELMEFQNFSIARMDSIMGDSCWRMDNPPMKPRPEDKVLFGVRGDYGLSKPQPIEWNTNTKYSTFSTDWPVYGRLYLFDTDTITGEILYIAPYKKKGDIEELEGELEEQMGE